MDFKRIELIFFIAFLGVNIFLFNIYQEARAEQNIVSRSNQKLPIEKRLASENITWEGDFSKENLQGYYLSGEPSDMKTLLDNERERLNNPKLLSENTVTDGFLLQHTITDGMYISDENQLEVILNAYFEQTDKVLLGSQYTYLPELTRWYSELTEVTAVQSFEGIPINDPSSTLILTLEKKDELLEVVQLTQTHISNLTALREAMRLYSEEDAINTLYINNKIPSNAKLKWRKLAYTLSLNVRGQNVYVPAWFVAIETADEVVHVERVNALTNVILFNQ